VRDTGAASEGETLALRDDHWNVVVAPALGGSVLACEYDGTSVMQPTLQPASARLRSLHCCHFPLIPWSNRIENGVFLFSGQTIRVAGNVAGSPHAIHGHGWQTPWRVVERSDTRCVLSFRHPSATDWPWAYEGRQTLAVVGDALHITLAIANLGLGAMPCGLGFHPFLPATGGARLQMHAAGIWDGRAGDFPTRRVRVPANLAFGRAPRVAERQGVDHCFDGWDGRATVSYEQADHRLLLTGCDATHSVIVYIPAGGDSFCVEPVTHTVNAMNLRDPAESGLWILEPQEARQITMSIRYAVSSRGWRPRRSRTSARSP
jgi:aldose 1-epimerase